MFAAAEIRLPLMDCLLQIKLSIVPRCVGTDFGVKESVQGVHAHRRRFVEYFRGDRWPLMVAMSRGRNGHHLPLTTPSEFPSVDSAG